MINRRIFAQVAIAALVAAPLAAQAHGPTRQKVEITTTIDAPAAKVWAVVSNFQDLSWLAPVAKVEGTGDSTPNVAKRTITLKNNEIIKESLEKLEADKMLVFYRMDEPNLKALPVANYSSRITVKDTGDGKSSVTWWGAFYRGYENNDPPPELSDEAAVKAVTDLYTVGLAGLKAKVEGAK